MFIDTKTLETGNIITCDICIVGGGAAGISIARELKNKSGKICLIESGGFEFNQETQFLSDGKNIGLPYDPIIDTSHRRLGGNTNLWNSFCRPLDDMDFEYRPWVADSGWPLTKQELMPFYERAQSVCKLRSLDYYKPENTVKGIGRPEYKILPLNKSNIATKIWQFYLPPINFGETYKSDLEKANNIDVYLYANAVNIKTNETATSVDCLQISCLDKRSIWIEAKAFILAMGGIETPRLLLASNKVSSHGLGNEHDIVGRYFMEHPHLSGVSKVVVNDKAQYPFLYTEGTRRLYSSLAGLCPSRQLQEEEKILNYSATLLPSKQLFATTSIMHKNLGKKVPAILDDAGYLVNKLLKKLFNRSKAPRLTLDILSRSEQAPNPDSRITLSREKDKLGLNKAILNWQLTDLDKRTILKSQQVIRDELRIAGIGHLYMGFSENGDYRLSSNSNEVSFGWGWHRMGTTRMHVDPKQGVVDKNCRVHGIHNLYIAGSSVFPTGGFANPTLTIVALALRLADHINDSYLKRQV